MRARAAHGDLARARSDGPTTPAALLAGIDRNAFDGHITFHLSESFAAAGESETALQLLADGVERGFYPHDYIATHCPFLASLRSRTEFRRIADRAAARVAAFRA